MRRISRDELRALLDAGAAMLVEAVSGWQAECWGEGLPPAGRRYIAAEVDAHG
jgi:hypothetical protein